MHDNDNETTTTPAPTSLTWEQMDTHQQNRYVLRVIFGDNPPGGDDWCPTMFDPGNFVGDWHAAQLVVKALREARPFSKRVRFVLAQQALIAAANRHDACVHADWLGFFTTPEIISRAALFAYGEDVGVVIPASWHIHSDWRRVAGDMTLNEGLVRE